MSQPDKTATDTGHRFKAVSVDCSSYDDDPEAPQMHDLWGGSLWQHPAGRTTINPDAVCRLIRKAMEGAGFVEVIDD